MFIVAPSRSLTLLMFLCPRLFYHQSVSVGEFIGTDVQYVSSGLISCHGINNLRMCECTIGAKNKLEFAVEFSAGLCLGFFCTKNLWCFTDQ